MGRLFQYNRFGSTGNANNNKDNNVAVKGSTLAKTLQTKRSCPPYHELYPEYSSKEATSKAIPAFTTIATKSTTTTASKSVDLAIKKYQQWSSKLMPTMSTGSGTLTSTEATAAPAVVNEQQSTTSTSCSTPSSGYHSKNDRTRLVDVCVAGIKRPKVYDCMKDFFRRKLFQQESKEYAKSETDDDVTSDYDEVDDVLDVSYHADEENSSECSSSCGDEEEIVVAFKSSKQSPLKSALSLNCWQSTTSSYSSESATSTDEEEINNLSTTAEDSDAGISDCCQLINEQGPKRHTRSKQPSKKQRYNLDDDDLPELLESSWYQPRINTRAAFKRLQHAEPGSFLVRRKSRGYQLWLRAETKVKQYTVLSCEDNYKLKGAKKQFSSLKALVTHHSVMAEQLPLTLTLPRQEKQQQWEEAQQFSWRYADDFDTFESLQVLGILKSLQAKSVEYS